MARPVAAMVGIFIVGMLIALDQTVVGTALPRMVADLQGFELYPWGAAAYLLATAILIPVTGRLGDLHGRKPYLLVSIALFIFASALCGMADGGINQPPVRQLFESPQVLLRPDEQEVLSRLAGQFGFDAATLVEQVRLSLVDGIHGAFFLCLLLAIFSYYLGRKLPPFVRQGQV